MADCAICGERLAVGARSTVSTDLITWGGETSWFFYPPECFKTEGGEEAEIRERVRCRCWPHYHLDRYVQRSLRTLTM